MAISPHQTPADWRASYRAAADALDRVWLQELAALSDDEALMRTLSLRLFTAAPPYSSDSSGLVEQQTLFRRAEPS